MDFPNFLEEQALWDNGVDLVIGIDEVGRGCFAGPVVAAAVAFSKDSSVVEATINDSKKLAYRKRALSEKWIKEKCMYGIGEVTVSEINNIGIGKASFLAMRKAIGHILKQKENVSSYLLIDAFYIPHMKGFGVTKQKPIVKGDGKCFSIAAASIIAKVYRDKLMEALGREYKEYGWGRNKGYGTREHQVAIKQFGITKHHRTAFVETFLSKSPLSQSY